MGEPTLPTVADLESFNAALRILVANQADEGCDYEPVYMPSMRTVLFCVLEFEQPPGAFQPRAGLVIRSN